MPQEAPEFFALQEAVTGRYSVVREIGRGGMGIVFLARDVALDRPVAIKMLPPELAASPEHRARFLREARTSARLSHPHIVPIFSVEEHADVVFFVMSFVEGETLGARVARAGPLPAAEAARIVQEVAWGLAHAHANGVIHRDVKPDNILLERGSGRALVTDFGIARVGQAAEETGNVIGTPRYMSPEQAVGGAVDARSDLYSLGVVAYFAATGRVPFEGKSPHAILTQHVSAVPAPVAEIRRGLPESLAQAIDRCLSKDPAARFASGEELAVALRSSLSGAIEIAPPVRAYVREVDAAGSEIATALTAALSALFILAITDTRVPGSGALNFTFIEAALYFGIAAAMTGLAGVRFGQLVSRARELLRLGYGQSAVRPALVLHERLDAQDEASMARISGGSMLLRIAATLAAMWLAGATNSTTLSLIGVAGSIAIPTIAIRGALKNAQKKGSWWKRLMGGRLGDFVFHIAGIGLSRDAAATPAAGEPTALAIGTAVNHLFAELPAEQQRKLADLPSVVAKLEADAMAIRLRTPAPAREERFVAAITALETLRLDLLRLHAKQGSPDDLTRDLDAAKRIGDDIAKQL